SFFSGATSAFDIPARQAMGPNLVPRNEIGQATSLTILLKTITTLAGPGIGGVLIAQFGLAATYGANALSFAAVIGALLLMGPVPMVRSVSTGAWNRIIGGLV